MIAFDLPKGHAIRKSVEDAKVKLEARLETTLVSRYFFDCAPLSRNQTLNLKYG